MEFETNPQCKCVECSKVIYRHVTHTPRITAWFTWGLNLPNDIMFEEIR